MEEKTVNNIKTVANRISQPIRFHSEFKATKQGKGLKIDKEPLKIDAQSVIKL